MARGDNPGAVLPIYIEERARGDNPGAVLWLEATIRVQSCLHRRPGGSNDFPRPAPPRNAPRGVAGDPQRRGSGGRRPPAPKALRWEKWRCPRPARVNSCEFHLAARVRSASAFIPPPGDGGEHGGLGRARVVISKLAAQHRVRLGRRGSRGRGRRVGSAPPRPRRRFDRGGGTCRWRDEKDAPYTLNTPLCLEIRTHAHARSGRANATDGSGE
eukprot:gene20463-biopygen17578